MKKLSLDGNNITIIKQFAFRGLTKLNELSIQHTPLSTIAPFAFSGLQNISKILLSHNKIKRVEGYAFAGTFNVRVILLTNNPILKLETFAFTGLSNVEHLILPSGVRTIEPDAFFGMDTVGLIKLAYMDLSSLAPFTFRGLTNVQLLSLQESDLGIICSNAFDGLSHVDTLNIMNNKIDGIQEFNISYSHYIRQIKFTGNHLLETPIPGSVIIDGVEILSIVYNHFPCGCHIHTLLESPFASGANTIEYFLSKNYCISPLDVNGRLMSEIDIYSIGRCSEQVTRGNLESSQTKIYSFSKFYLLVLVITYFNMRILR